MTAAGGRSARPLWQMRNFGIFWAAHPVLRSLTAVLSLGCSLLAAIALFTPVRLAAPERMSTAA